MKNINYVAALIIYALSACAKSGVKEMITPAPIYFEILDKGGKSIVNSISDTISVSYLNNNVSQKLKLTVIDMQTSSTDASGQPKYKGLCILDNAKMTSLSSRIVSPIYDFTLSFKGTNLGTVHLNYLDYLNAYPKTSSPALTFNNVEVVEDNSVINTAGGKLNLNLLQLQ